MIKIEFANFLRKRKKWIFVFVLLEIFLLGFLLGWALEFGAYLNGEIGSPFSETLETRLWPFIFWKYLY